MRVKVRDATANDIDSLEAIINQYWKVSVDHHRELNNKSARLLVAERIGKNPSRDPIVGTGLMWVTAWNKTGYLVELAVDKNLQRKGIGIALVKKFAKLARGLGLRAIIVETQPGNKNAVDFYLANGFRLCGYNDRYYVNNPKSSREIALFFSLDLND